MFTPVRKRKSPVFQYYTSLADNLIRCNICMQNETETVFEIKYSIYRVAEMHLQKVHTIFLDQKKARKTAINIDKITKNIEEHYIVDMVCNYNVPIRTITSSPFFSLAFSAMNLGRTETPAEIIAKELQKYRLSVKFDMDLRKRQLEIFSISIQSYKKTRLINISLHLQDKATKNLGFIKIINQDSLFEQIRMKLEGYGISLDRDIASICHDKSIWSEELAYINGEGQSKCLLQGIHEVVTESIFNIPFDFTVQIKLQNEELHEFQEFQTKQQEDELTSKFNSKLIRKIRKNILAIKRHGALQKKLEELCANKAVKKVLIDHGNNWVSKFLMLERYLQIFPEIQITLSKMGFNLLLTCKQKEKLNELVTYLKPFYLCHSFLCDINANIYKANQYMLLIESQLSKINSTLSHSLVSSLRVCFENRMNFNFLITLSYLQMDNPKQIAEKHRQILTNTLLYLLNRKTQERTDSFQSKVTSEEKDSQKLIILLSKEVKNNKRVPLNKKMARISITEIEAYMKDYQASRQKPLILLRAEKILQSMPITTFECQKNFDSVSHILAKRQEVDLSLLQGVSILGKDVEIAFNLMRQAKKQDDKSE